MSVEMSVDQPAADPAAHEPTVAHKTSDQLSKFEFTRLVGLRTLQLTSQGTCDEDPQAAALRELLEGTNPAIVRRKLPDGRHEDRHVRELKLSAVLRHMCVHGL